MLNSKKIFLIDSIGALVTSMLMLVFSLNDFVGIDKSQLLWLSALAFAYSFYSFFCYKFVKKAMRDQMLLVIIFLNLMHSFALVPIVCTINNTSIFGYIYFSLEAVVIALLVMIEWSVYKRLKHYNSLMDFIK